MDESQAEWSSGPRANQPKPVGGQLADQLRKLTSADRVARGKAARKAVPRESHGAFTLPPDRPEPVALLEAQAQSRVR